MAAPCSDSASMPETKDSKNERELIRTLPGLSTKILPGDIHSARRPIVALILRSVLSRNRVVNGYSPGLRLGGVGERHIFDLASGPLRRKQLNEVELVRA